mgnify:CR=1 FL=1
MITVHSEAELRRHVGVWHQAAESVGLVPTMGALHEGHLSLVDRARELVDRVVVSLFVNPSQFGPGEDLDRYPRTPERDAQMLERRGVDLLFAPEAETIYPQGFVTWIDLEGPPAHGLEAAHRPGHFRGVATVVLKLFNLAPADRAYFGRKDYQQQLLIRRMCRDLDVPVVEVESAAALSVESTPEGLARGAYLFHHVAVCADCHSLRDPASAGGPPRPGTLGKGGEPFPLGEGKVVYARNITPTALPMRNSSAIRPRN